MRIGRPACVGLAIGANEIVLAFRGNDVVRASYTSLETLSGFLQKVQSELELRRAVVCAAILPPLVDVRAVELPALKPNEIRSVLTHHARRYFPYWREPLVTAWRPASDREQNASLRILAAATPETIAEALQTAVDSVGWTLDDVVPAHASWLVVAHHDSRAGDTFSVQLDDRLVQFGLSSGKLSDVRTAKDGLLKSAPSESGLGKPVDDPAEAAARYAFQGRRFGWSLVPERTRALRRKQYRKQLASGAGFVIVLLVLSGTLELWGLKREIGLVTERRAAVAGEVSAAAAQLEALHEPEAFIFQIDSVAATRHRWTPAIADLTINLPRDSHLLALFVSGDSMIVDVRGPSGDSVYSALQSTPGVQAVHSLPADASSDEVSGGDAFRFLIRFSSPSDPATVVGGPSADLNQGSSRSQGELTVQTWQVLR